jgi:dihydrodipicolinate synthase/N-acetylneuraminate lyase
VPARPFLGSWKTIAFGTSATRGGVACTPEVYAPRVIRGAFAAALTPLRDGGSRLDEDAFGPYTGWLADGGVDGILALGTTGEGILLTGDERRRAAALFIDAAQGRLAVAVHCGAQTTADTAALAAHAAEAGADAVAVIAPPFFPLDEAALEAHLAAAAAACAPLPFYVYEFAARSGYAVPVAVIERLRERAPNLRGLKVSDKPWEKVEPYLLDGLDVFVGAESLVARGLAAGAAGAVSGLAAAFPEVVAALVSEPTQERSDEAERLRATLDGFPFQAALKAVVARRGVLIGPDVRAPLRTLTAGELERLELP